MTLTSISQVSRQVFDLKEITKTWPGKHGFSLFIPKLTIRQGEKVALVGASGCGKSTLLDLLAMILKPDEAHTFAFCYSKNERLNVAQAWKEKDVNGLARVRLRHIGYVLQTGGLLPFLSVRDNIGLSQAGLGLLSRESVLAVSEKLGIARHLDKYPAQLSVGERQRVAIARAMAHEPAVVIADEPTASLDPIKSEEIMTLFMHLVNEFGVTLIVSTHDWGRVDQNGFRRINFNLAQDNQNGQVRAVVTEK